MRLYTVPGAGRPNSHLWPDDRLVFALMVAASQLRAQTSARPVASYASDPRYTVVVTSTRSLPAFIPRELDVTERCARALGATPSSLRRAGEQRPWVAIDTQSASEGLMVIHVSPRPRISAPCPTGIEQNLPFSLRGIQFERASVYDESRDPSQVRVIQDRAPVSPVRIARQPMIEPASGGQSRYSQVRAYIDPMALYGPDGRFRDVALEVVSAAGSTSFISIPDSSIRTALEDIIPARLMAFERATPLVTQTQRWLPEATDSRLRTAIGGGVGSPSAAAERLTAHMSARDSVIARFFVASALSATSDSSAGLLLVREMMDSHPCLSVVATAPVALRTAVERFRPSTWCDVPSVRSVTMRGLAVPGGGEFATRHTFKGWLVSTMATAAIGVGTARYIGAIDSHRNYLAATRSSDAASFRAQANAMRRQARVATTAGIVVWVGGLLDARLWASTQNRELRSFTFAP